MARPATGSVRWHITDKVWTVRVTTAKGGRSKPIAMTGLPPCAVEPNRPPRGCTCGPCVFAEEAGRQTAKTYRDAGAVPNETSLTVSEWFGKYYKAAAIGSVGRKNRGKPQASVDDRKGRFEKWIEPEIGTMPMACVTAADLRRIVQRLDEQIRIRAAFYDDREGEGEAHEGRKPGLSAKTAQNIFGEITSGFKEACHSKLDELRVLDVNPALGVQPPTSTEEREQAALYPTEVVRLLSEPSIPRSRRRTYFVAIYAGMRRSELVRLTAADVALEYELVMVRGKKSNAAKRRVPIEPGLRPLLVALVKARKTGPLLDVPRADGKGGAADLVKKDLERAGLTRSDLTRDDADHMPFTFHGLRHTCITHAYVAGRDETFLKVVYGHTSNEMTRRYLDNTAVGSAAFGTPHPELPPDVIADLLADLEGVEVPSEFRAVALPEVPSGANYVDSHEILRPQRESNAQISTHDSAPETTPQPEKQGMPSDAGPEDSTEVSQRATLDGDLRALAKRYIDAGEIARAMGILAMLDEAPKQGASEAGKHEPKQDASVIDLAAHRRAKG